MPSSDKKDISLKELIKQEYLKCAKDPVYFLYKYATIEHRQKGKIPFKLWDFQKQTLRDFVKHDFVIILKARQLGISTLVAGYALHTMLFGNSKLILVIATKQETAKNLVTKVKVMFDGLPSWLKLKLVESNKLSLKFSNDSMIVAEASSDEAGRSHAASLLILDESAFIPKIDKIWTAAQSTLATGGGCIALSTPNGVGGWFYDTWISAINKTSKFYPIKLHWSVHPERDQKWRDEQTVALGEDKANQECECSFLQSGRTVISGMILDYCKKTYVRDPIEKRGIDSNLWIWKAPVYTKDSIYILAADVARGDGSDYSAFHVIDVASVEQVAEYHGKMSTTDFGNLCVNVAKEYNDALLIIENNNIGWAAIQQAINREYSNLFYSSKDLQYVDVYHQLTNKIYREERKMIPGFSTTIKTRPLLIAKLEEFFRTDSIKLRSNRTLEELLRFVYVNNKAEAMSGYNDDLVISLAIALWVRETTLRLKAEGIKLQKKTLDYLINGSGIYVPKETQSSEWDWDVQDDKESLTWLL